MAQCIRCDRFACFQTAEPKKLPFAIVQVRVFFGLCHMLAGAIWAVANIYGMNLNTDYYENAETHGKFEQVRFYSNIYEIHHFVDCQAILLQEVTTPTECGAVRQTSYANLTVRR